MRWLLFLCCLLLPSGAAALEARLLVSNPAPWAGEEVILTLELRSAERPVQPLEPVWPAWDGGTLRELPLAPPYRDGNTLVQPVRRALRPLDPGTLVVAGAGVRAGPLQAAAEPLRLRVRPLPEAGRPADFGGAVGDCRMHLAADGHGTREIVLSLAGTAPLADFPLPQARLGAGERLLLVADLSSGEPPGERQRLLRYLYLPGEGQRGSLSFVLPIFDPHTGSYREMHATVAAGPPGAWLFALPLLAVLAGASTWAWQRRRCRSFEGEIARLLDLNPAVTPRRTLLATLQTRGVDAATCAELESYWRSIDAVRFAPSEPAVPAPPPSSRRLARRLRKAIDKTRRIP